MESSSWPVNVPSDRQRAIDELLRGRHFTNMLKIILNQSSTPDQESVPAEDLLLKISTSFTNTLSILNRADSDEVSQFLSPSWNGRKSEDSGDSSKSSSTMKNRRGCYKRRRTCESRTMETPDLVDDGYAWRKYGQKDILNAKYPRNYFRCTHKYDEACQANKHVQRIQEDPPLYRTTYNGNHTCKNLIRTNHDLTVDCCDANGSSILLSFSGSTDAEKHHPFFTTSSLIPSNVKLECEDDENKVKSNNHSSSSDYILSAYDRADVNNSSSSCTNSTTHQSFDMDHLIVPSIDPNFDDDVLQYEF